MNWAAFANHYGFVYPNDPLYRPEKNGPAYAFTRACLITLWNGRYPKESHRQVLLAMMTRYRNTTNGRHMTGPMWETLMRYIKIPLHESRSWMAVFESSVYDIPQTKLETVYIHTGVRASQVSVKVVEVHESLLMGVRNDTYPSGLGDLLGIKMGRSVVLELVGSTSHKEHDVIINGITSDLDLCIRGPETHEDLQGVADDTLATLVDLLSLLVAHALETRVYNDYQAAPAEGPRVELFNYTELMGEDLFEKWTWKNNILHISFQPTLGSVDIRFCVNTPVESITLKQLMCKSATVFEGDQGVIRDVIKGRLLHEGIRDAVCIAPNAVLERLTAHVYQEIRGDPVVSTVLDLMKDSMKIWAPNYKLPGFMLAVCVYFGKRVLQEDLTSTDVWRLLVASADVLIYFLNPTTPVKGEAYSLGFMMPKILATLCIDKVLALFGTSAETLVDLFIGPQAERIKNFTKDPTWGLISFLTQLPARILKRHKAEFDAGDDDARKYAKLVQRYNAERVSFTDSGVRLLCVWLHGLHNTTRRVRRYLCAECLRWLNTGQPIAAYIGYKEIRAKNWDGCVVPSQNIPGPLACGLNQLHWFSMFMMPGDVIDDDRVIHALVVITGQYIASRNHEYHGQFM